MNVQELRAGLRAEARRTGTWEVPAFVAPRRRPRPGWRGVGAVLAVAALVAVVLLVPGVWGGEEEAPPPLATAAPMPELPVLSPTQRWRSLDEPGCQAFVGDCPRPQSLEALGVELLDAGSDSSGEVVRVAAFEDYVLVGALDGDSDGNLVLAVDGGGEVALPAGGLSVVRLPQDRTEPWVEVRSAGGGAPDETAVLASYRPRVVVDTDAGVAWEPLEPCEDSPGCRTPALVEVEGREVAGSSSFTSETRDGDPVLGADVSFATAADPVWVMVAVRGAGVGRDTGDAVLVAVDGYGPLAVPVGDEPTLLRVPADAAADGVVRVRAEVTPRSGRAGVMEIRWYETLG